MYAKTSLIVAALAATTLAAEEEKRQITIPVSLIPTGLLPSGFTSDAIVIPTAIVGQIESELIPVLTALPASVLSQVTAVAATLQPSDFPAFYSSVLSDLPPDVRSSVEAGYSSVLGGISSVASEVSSAITSASGAVSSAQSSVTSGVTLSTPTETGTTMVTSTGSVSGTSSRSSTAGSSSTSSSPSASTTPSSAGRNYIGFSLMGIAGVLALAIAL